MFVSRGLSDLAPQAASKAQVPPEPPVFFAADSDVTLLEGAVSAAIFALRERSPLWPGTPDAIEHW